VDLGAEPARHLRGLEPTREVLIAARRLEHVLGPRRK
jgi:hypothetical protein